MLHLPEHLTQLNPGHTSGWPLSQGPGKARENGSPSPWALSSHTIRGAGCLEFISTWCKAHGHGVSGWLMCGLDSKKQGSLNFLFGVLLF